MGVAGQVGMKHPPPNPSAAQPAPDEPPPHDSGQTTPHLTPGAGPRLPHERDESSDSQPQAPGKVIRQAGKDVERGLVDTDKGPVLDEVYERQVRPQGERTEHRGAPEDAKGSSGESTEKEAAADPHRRS